MNAAPSLRQRSLCLVLALLLAGATGAAAQVSPERMQAAASLASDLEFPAAPSAMPSSGLPMMALYKPEGAGPFPALVLVHQCGGLGSARRPNVSMLEWARQAVARGYVALLVDSLAPRGVAMVCYGPLGGVTFARGVKDALQAAEHLRRFAFVDQRRIALAGWSWGAMVALLAASRRWSEALAPGGRFAAAVAFYPGCFTIRPPLGAAYEIVNADIDRPLLVLMGEADNETPARECAPRLEAARAAGAPLDWHVYPGATHCWDCAGLDGYARIDFRGNRVTYRHDRTVTEDSTRRMFRFLAEAMPARP